MEFSLQERSRPAFIPLRDAVLCLDCHFITPPGNNLCSVCGGRVLVGVTQILSVLLEEPRAAEAPSGLTEESGSRLRVIDSSSSRLTPSRPRELVL